MGLPGSLCTRIYTAFKSFNSKILTNSKHPLAPTKQMGEHSGRPASPPLPPTALGFTMALDVFQLGKRKKRGSLRSIYINICSIKTIK